MASGLQVGQVNTILNAVTATGRSAIFQVPTAQRGITGFIQTWTWQITITGAPSNVSIALQGSLDGATWQTIDSSTSTTNSARVVNLSNTNAGPFAFVSINLATLTGGTNPTVTALLAAGAI